MDADAVESELMEIEGFDAVDADLMKVQAAGQDGGRVELDLCRAHGGPVRQGRAHQGGGGGQAHGCSRLSSCWLSLWRSSSLRSRSSAAFSSCCCW